MRRRARAASSLSRALPPAAEEGEAAYFSEALLAEVVLFPAVQLRGETGHQADARGEATGRECCSRAARERVFA